MHKSSVLGTGLGLDCFFLLISNNLGLLERGKGLSISDGRRLSLLPAFELSLSAAVSSDADAFRRTPFSPRQP